MVVLSIDKANAIKGMQAKYKKVLAAARKGMIKGFELFKAKIIREQMSGRSSSSLGKISGFLARSWYIKSWYVGSDSRVKLATEAKYSAIHQFGGVIKPQNGRALAVPIHKDAKGHSPSEFNDLVYVKRNGRPPLLIQSWIGGNMGGGRRRGGMKIMFVLISSVKIPKRLHVYEDFNKYGNKIIGNAIIQEIASAK
jgi:phage gpG-like protein